MLDLNSSHMTELELPKEVERIMEFLVEEQHSAKFLGSGDVQVFATPSMILMMERACRLLADDHLPKGYTTVGVRVCIEHLAAAPVGAKVQVHAKLLEQNGRKLKFEVLTKWKEKLIGKGEHDRFIINHERFMKKLEESLRNE